jgi:hypothetical protein
MSHLATFALPVLLSLSTDATKFVSSMQLADAIIDMNIIKSLVHPYQWKLPSKINLKRALS